MKLTAEQKQSIMDFSASLDGWAEQKFFPKHAYSAMFSDGTGGCELYYCPLGYYAHHVLGIESCSDMETTAILFKRLTQDLACQSAIINDYYHLTTEEKVERIRHNCQQVIAQG